MNYILYMQTPATGIWQIPDFYALSAEHPAKTELEKRVEARKEAAKAEAKKENNIVTETDRLNLKVENTKEKARKEVANRQLYETEQQLILSQARPLTRRPLSRVEEFVGYGAPGYSTLMFADDASKHASLVGSGLRNGQYGSALGNAIKVPADIAMGAVSLIPGVGIVEKSIVDVTKGLNTIKHNTFIKQSLLRNELNTRIAKNWSMVPDSYRTVNINPTRKVFTGKRDPITNKPIYEQIPVQESEFPHGPIKLYGKDNDVPAMMFDNGKEVFVGEEGVNGEILMPTKSYGNVVIGKKIPITQLPLLIHLEGLNNQTPIKNNSFIPIEDKYDGQSAIWWNRNRPWAEIDSPVNRILKINESDVTPVRNMTGFDSPGFVLTEDPIDISKVSALEYNPIWQGYGKVIFQPVANLNIYPKNYTYFGSYKQGGPLNYLSLFKFGGGIHIKPENKGKFTATKKRTGKTTEELTHSKNPLTRKRAIFALNMKRIAERRKRK